MSDKGKQIILFSRNEPDYESELTAAEKCIRGQPTHQTWNHFVSDDEKCFAGIWEGDEGCIRVEYSENEFCHLLSGAVIVRDESGYETHLSAGDNFVIPAGFKGEWETVLPARKIYVVYQP
jgi:uncharacterized cupin superfamily protein